MRRLRPMVRLIIPDLLKHADQPSNQNHEESFWNRWYSCGRRRGPLDAPTIFATGLALASTLKHLHPAPRVLLGADTRESSPWISAVIAAGLERGGAEVLNGRGITTPGVAYLTRQHRYAAGGGDSASHNPWQDNGIKVFGAAMATSCPTRPRWKLRRKYFAASKKAPRQTSRG